MLRRDGGLARSRDLRHERADGARTPGAIDESPIWSPDGSAIAFIRQDGAVSDARMLMIWYAGDPAATPLTGPVRGLPETLSVYDAVWKRVPL